MNTAADVNSSRDDFRKAQEYAHFQRLVEQMRTRSELVSRQAAQLVAAYKPNGLKSWSDDYLPAWQRYFLFENGPKPLSEIIGICNYRVRKDPKSNKWLAQIYYIPTDGTREQTKHSKTFDDEDAAWLETAIWRCFADLRIESEHPGSWTGIHGIPLGDLLTPGHIKAVYEARCLLKKRLEPNFYRRCEELRAILPAMDPQTLASEMEEAKLLDRVGRGEEIPPETLVKYKLVHAIEVERKRATERRLDPITLKIDKESIASQVRLGQTWLPIELRTRTLNRKLDTNISRQALMQRLHRLNLYSTLHAGAVHWYYRKFCQADVSPASTA